MEKITMKTKTAELIEAELNNIPEKYRKPFNSIHEGYGILLEEVREIENEIFFGEKKAKLKVLELINNEAATNLLSVEHSKSFVESETQNLHKARIREEAVQVAAMAIRIIQELT